MTLLTLIILTTLFGALVGTLLIATIAAGAMYANLGPLPLGVIVQLIIMYLLLGAAGWVIRLAIRDYKKGE